MSNFISSFVSKVFGSKSDRDIKEITPVIAKISAEFSKLQSISHDELRAKTTDFKARIKAHTSNVSSEIESLKARIENEPDMDISEKVELYDAIDKLGKKENELIEEVLKEILPEAFAVVKETARRFSTNESIEVTATDADRELAAHKENVISKGDKAIHNRTWIAAGNAMTWEMVHYDVQLIGGSVLHSGKIAEMGTGEGKTLVATLPAYLNALAGKGVHIVTVNDYLARRDSEWMGPLYEFHGLTVDCIDKHQPNSPERRKAYQADITFGTNNEFGFDYLRDNMAHAPEDLVQRKHNYAIVDEVDSVLIDDARTPLIISGPVPQGDRHEFDVLKPSVDRIVSVQKQIVTQLLSDAKKLIAAGNKTEGGFKLLQAYRGLPKNKHLIKFLSEEGIKVLLQKTEGEYLQDNAKRMRIVDQELYFVID